MAYTRAQFITKIAPMAQEDMEKTGILASLTIAQACLESANGNSGLTVRSNNLFGIKGSYNGQSDVCRTAEYKPNGEKYYIDAAFRKYPSWAESIADHSDLFNRLSRYANLRGETDIKKACYNVRADGYATDPKYPDLLMSIVNTFNLTQYDKKPVSEDKQLADAVSKIIKSGVTLDFNSWKRMDLIQLSNVPALIDKLGGISYLKQKEVISNIDIWATKKYNANHVRSLLIKFAAKC